MNHFKAFWLLPTQCFTATQIYFIIKKRISVQIKMVRGEKQFEITHWLSFMSAMSSCKIFHNLFYTAIINSNILALLCCYEILLNTNSYGTNQKRLFSYEMIHMESIRMTWAAMGHWRWWFFRDLIYCQSVFFDLLKVLKVIDLTRWYPFSPCQRQCELLPSLGVRRLSSVNFSHFNLLLWNLSAKWTETW